MECKITSAARRPRAGFTYVELLVAGALSTLFALTLVTFTIFSGRSLLAASNRMDLEAQSRTALDVLTREMRSSITLKECKANSITFHDFDKELLVFKYDSKKRQLLWDCKRKGSDLVLLNDCDNITFTLYGRVPSSGSYDLVPVTDPDHCKAVKVSMDCSRTFVAPKIQALNTLTATIVLRMK